MTTYTFSASDSHLSNTKAGKIALEEYECALLRGLSHEDAELTASNSLQRAGYNVNARGGVTIEVLE